MMTALANVVVVQGWRERHIARRSLGVGSRLVPADSTIRKPPSTSATNPHLENDFF